MRYLFLICFFLNSLQLAAQHQHFELEIADSSTFKFEVYKELKEQLGDDGWGAWEKMNYSFVLKDFVSYNDQISFQVCYNHEFLDLFSDTLGSDTNYVYCHSIMYHNEVLSLISVEAKFLKLRLKNLETFNYNASSALPQFTFTGIINDDILGFLAAYKPYDNKEKVKSETGIRIRLFETNGADNFVESSSLIGNFNNDKNLKELHILKEYDYSQEIEKHKSSHVAFNKDLKITEIFQDLSGYTLFFDNSFYSFTHQFMITRKDGVL